VILSMPISTLAAVIVLVAFAATVITFVIVDCRTDRTRQRLHTVEQQLKQIVALADQEQAAANALDDAAHSAQRQMLREVVAAWQRLGKEVS